MILHHIFAYEMRSGFVLNPQIIRGKFRPIWQSSFRSHSTNFGQKCLKFQPLRHFLCLMDILKGFDRINVCQHTVRRSCCVARWKANVFFLLFSQYFFWNKTFFFRLCKNSTVMKFFAFKINDYILIWEYFFVFILIYLRKIETKSKHNSQEKIKE